MLHRNPAHKVGSTRVPGGSAGGEQEAALPAGGSGRGAHEYAAAYPGWEVSRQRVGNAFGVRYREYRKEFCIELPYFGGTVQSRQRS